MIEDPKGLVVNVNSRVFNRVENCGDYAAAGNTPYSLEQVIGIAFNLVYQTGLFVDKHKSWKRLPTQKNLDWLQKFLRKSSQ